MTRIPSWLLLIVPGVLVVLSGATISAQDKYTLQVPGGLAFSEFRGYERWPVIAISENQGVMAVIMGNPIMIDAYKEGVPGNGKPFPDGAKMAKIHWSPKKQEAYPGQPTVPGTQHDVDFMVKDSKRFADSGRWGGARSTMTQHPTRSRPQPWLTRLPRGTMPSVDSRATRW
jgi:Cytochrome P460